MGIPFNRPHITGTELTYLEQALHGGHWHGDGPFTKRCEQLMQERFGARRVLLTTSCTAALEMAALLVGIGPGDEVIVPSFTFVSTANAFALRGATLVFADIRPDTLNMDESALEDVITERTRAVVPVHYASIGCELDIINEVADRHQLTVIEDAAQAVNATWRGRYLGTLGALGAYSFHATKNFAAGEGGALLVNREEFDERAEVLREKGTNRSQFFRGQVDKYTWIDVGSSFIPSDLLAALLLAQLEHMDATTALRAKIAAWYRTGLAPLEERGLVELPVVPPHSVFNHHMFQVMVADLDVRTKLLAHLRSRGIGAVFHYVPLHTSTMGARLGYRRGMLPHTEACSDRLVRLPMFADLSEAEVARVCEEMSSFFGQVVQTRAR